METKLESQKKQQIPLPDQKSIQMVEELKNKLILVENAEKNKFFVSQNIIKEILSEKMPDIKISQIHYENDATEGKKVSISGTAPSRERLLLFRRALEENTSFVKVDLPISNFVKGSNIQFSLSLIPK